MEEAAKDMALRHLWVLDAAVYAVGIVIALMLWGYARKRLAARGGGTWPLLIQALGTPLVFVIVGVGIQRIVQSIADNIPYIAFETDAFRSFIIVVCFFWALLRLTAVAEKIYDRPLRIGDASIERGAVQATFRVARYIVIIIAALTLMESLGFSISGFLAFGGIGVTVVAFAAQKTLSNFFSGMIIFTERPFLIGDWIRCPGTEVEGVVERIGWRTTQLRTFDQRPLYVPNAMFSDNIIENPQRMLNRRIYETMGLRYDDIGKMAAVLEDIRAMLKNHADLDQEQIQMVNFDRYGDSSLDFFIYVMTSTVKWRDFHRIKEDVLLQIAVIVTKHGAEFAFPTRTLHIAGGDVSQSARSSGD